jgi:monofunctional glycosyltransferase
MAGARKPSWPKAALIALAVLALLPVGGVLMVAVLPPAPTILMLRQAVRGEGLDYQWRGLKDISPNLVNAAIAAEDARFCSHHGFDMKAIQKALDHNAEGGRIRGGSTISQQTAKNVFLWPGRDWIRKGSGGGLHRPDRGRLVQAPDHGGLSERGRMGAGRLWRPGRRRATGSARTPAT